MRGVIRWYLSPDQKKSPAYPKILFRKVHKSTSGRNSSFFARVSDASAFSKISNTASVSSGNAKRDFVKTTETGLMSQPNDGCPTLRAAAKVVPEPHHGSRITAVGDKFSSSNFCSTKDCAKAA